MTDERPGDTRSMPVDRRMAWPSLAATLAALVALFGGGYWVYTHVVGTLLFQAQSAPILPKSLILALAILAGAPSFFSPRSLAITPAFLAYIVEKDSRRDLPPSPRRMRSASQHRTPERGALAKRAGCAKPRAARSSKEVYDTGAGGRTRRIGSSARGPRTGSSSGGTNTATPGLVAL